MINRLIRLATTFAPEGASKDTTLLVGGMASLLTGNRLLGLSLMGRGMWRSERRWREEHPEFTGSWRDRWALAIAHYERTHQDPINRALHVVGIPMIAGGAAGLLLSAPPRPLWLVSASSFTVGWLLNLVGHGVFEKNAPAFTEDPLSFIAGPIWDLRQLGMMRRAVRVPSVAVPMAPTAQA